MKRVCSAAIALWLLPSTSVFASDDLGPMPRGKTASKQWADRGWAMVEEVRMLLASADLKDHTKALDKTRALLSARLAFVTGTKGDGLIGSFYAGEHFEDVIALADYGIQQHPESTIEIIALQRYKALSLGKLKRSESISAAKIYYNIALLKDSGKATDLLATTLLALDASAVEKVDAFRKEQTELRNEKIAIDDGLAIPTGSNLLESIPVDPQPYEKALAATVGSDYRSLVAAGNLLLLSDRAREALPVFTEAFSIAEPRDALFAAENVARAIRAVDGSPCRAAMWMNKRWPQGPVDDPRLAENAGTLATTTQPDLDLSVIAKNLGVSVEDAAWLHAWQDRETKQLETLDEQIEQFEAAFASSRYPIDTCLALKKACEKVERLRGSESLDPHFAPFPPVTAVMVRQAMQAAEIETAEKPYRRDVVVAKVVPLVGRLWFGKTKDAAALEQFYRILAKDRPVGSDDWYHGNLGMAEVIGKQGRNEEAIAALNTLEERTPNLDNDQRDKIRFDRASILFRSKRFADSIKEFRPIVSSPKSPYRPLAWSTMLIAMSEAKMKKADVQEEYDSYIKTIKPNEEQASSLQFRIAAMDGDTSPVQ